MSGLPPIGSQADLDDRRQALEYLLAETRQTIAALDGGEVHEMDEALADTLVLFRAAGCPTTPATTLAYLLGVTSVVSKLGDRRHQDLLPCLAHHNGKATALGVMLMDRKGRQ